jgi:hypothetical protein
MSSPFDIVCLPKTTDREEQPQKCPVDIFCRHEGTALQQSVQSGAMIMQAERERSRV